jgi:predicted N-acyltransferase
MTEQEREAVAAAGWLPRLTYQFHFENAGFASFDDFLATLRSPARKQIRRERRVASELGLTMETLEGHALTEGEWDAVYGFYRDTAARKGAFPYLTHAFFRMARTRLGHRAIVTLARKDGVPVASALSFRKGRHLYGRYWGCRGDYEMLHFELCYYRLVDFAIANGITLFEAGAQGEHKLKRGFLPRPTYSAHWLAHPGLRGAVAEYLPREEEAVRQEMAELRALGPHRRDRCEE